MFHTLIDPPFTAPSQSPSTLLFPSNWTSTETPLLANLLNNPLQQEAQEIAADIPEDRFTHGQSEAEPKKVRSIQMGGVPMKICFQAIASAQ